MLADLTRPCTPAWKAAVSGPREAWARPLADARIGGLAVVGHQSELIRGHPRLVNPRPTRGDPHLVNPRLIRGDPRFVNPRLIRVHLRLVSPQLIGGDPRFVNPPDC
jgi:hypothetical protein